MLTMIGRNIDILDRMVREMLDMSAMTSGNFSVKQNTLLLRRPYLECGQRFFG
ncbi:MAG: hypothetical protein Q9P01_12800 [Anaerolineae bacterium]|nr:hypothetical protein [Anaerolineae bacterium]